MSDYKGALFPKPKRKKKQKKTNGYKDKAERICKYCGKPYAERHELFYGPLRQTSIDFGFQIDVCPEQETTRRRATVGRRTRQIKGRN